LSSIESLFFFGFSPSTSRLSILLGIKHPFFCTLDLLQVIAHASYFSIIKFSCIAQAMDELENSCAFSKRLYVPPTYAELRKIVNIAQAEALDPPSTDSHMIHCNCDESL
jgi:hypothetical protein